MKILALFYKFHLILVGNNSEFENTVLLFALSTTLFSIFLHLDRNHRQAKGSSSDAGLWHFIPLVFGRSSSGGRQVEATASDTLVLQRLCRPWVCGPLAL